MEHEHADHPDYRFPVVVEYCGSDPLQFAWCTDEGIVPMTAEEAEAHRTETHALIYTDGVVAVTMYECTYAMWYVRDGSLAGGSGRVRGEWELTAESLVKIRGAT